MFKLTSVQQRTQQSHVTARALFVVLNYCFCLIIISCVLRLMHRRPEHRVHRSLALLQDVTPSVLLTFHRLWCENKNNIDFAVLTERERLHTPLRTLIHRKHCNTHIVASISMCVCAGVTLNVSSAYRRVGRVCVDGPPSVDLFHWANTSKKTFNTVTLFTLNLWDIFQIVLSRDTSSGAAAEYTSIISPVWLSSNKHRAAGGETNVPTHQDEWNDAMAAILKHLQLYWQLRWRWSARNKSNGQENDSLSWESWGE